MCQRGVVSTSAAKNRIRFESVNYVDLFGKCELKLRCDDEYTRVYNMKLDCNEVVRQNDVHTF